MDKIVELIERVPIKIRALAAATSALLIIFMFVGYAVYLDKQADCLTSRVHHLWSWTGPTAGKDLETGKQQIEAIVRVLIASDRRNKAHHCSGKIVSTAQKAHDLVFSKADETSRRTMIYPIAMWSLVGWHYYEWPNKWRCVNDFRGTALRFWKDAEYWYREYMDTGHEVGRIGTMKLYCRISS